MISAVAEKIFQDELLKSLKKSTHYRELYEVMEYAVFPPGKLFRPKLIHSIALDLNGAMDTDHLHLASAVELHHAYTLVHDDLPAMDNDLLRRGKPSTHVRFGEWKAILAGDALLIDSFDQIQKIQHPNYRQIFRLMSWATGGKGLILGQFLDLSADRNSILQNIIRIHELKTGRLIQLSTLGAYLLAPDQTFKGRVDFLRLGRDIGVFFQLLDDLSELTSSVVSSHEKQVNPFLSAPVSALHHLKKTHHRLLKIIYSYRLKHLEKIVQEYCFSNQKNFNQHYSELEKNLPLSSESNFHTEFKDLLTSFA